MQELEGMQLCEVKMYPLVLYFIAATLWCPFNTTRTTF